MIKSNKAVNFYHGTAVGWLMTSGFFYQKVPFGEASPPHGFLYLCSQYRGAESSARHSKMWCEARIEKDAAFGTNFTRNPKGVPEAVVYTIDIANLKSIDWAMLKLERTEAGMLVAGLRKIHQRESEMLEFFARRVALFMRGNRRWQDWVEFVAENYLSGPGDDRRAIIFKESGFEVVRNFESLPDSKYGEVVALIYSDTPHMPTNCIFV